jgi:hypothetical protein
VAIQTDAASLPAINLGGLLAPLTAEVLLDEFLQANAKPEDFRIHIVTQGAQPTQFVIDSVNSKTIEALPLEISQSKVVDGNLDVIARIKIKTLAKFFQKGINRFEVSFKDQNGRTAVETILNIQM